MPDFDRSCIYGPFTVEGQAGTFFMLDEAIYQEALQGLTPAQQATIAGYRMVLPTPPVEWAERTPAPVYFKCTELQAQSALKRRYS